MSLRYQTVHYEVHRRSQEDLTAVFSQSAEGRQLVQACLWFTASCTTGVYAVSFISVWNMPPFWTGLHQFFPLGFFLRIALFFPSLVKMTSNFFYSLLKFSPLYPNNPVTNDCNWVGCMKRVGRLVGQGSWLFWVRLVRHLSRYLLNFWQSCDSGLRGYHYSPLVFTVIIES